MLSRKTSNNEEGADNKVAAALGFGGSAVLCKPRFPRKEVFLRLRGGSETSVQTQNPIVILNCKAETLSLF